MLLVICPPLALLFLLFPQSFGKANTSWSPSAQIYERIKPTMVHPASPVSAEAFLSYTGLYVCLCVPRYGCDGQQWNMKTVGLRGWGCAYLEVWGSSSSLNKVVNGSALNLVQTEHPSSFGCLTTIVHGTCGCLTRLASQMNTFTLG